MFQEMDLSPEARIIGILLVDKASEEPLQQNHEIPTEQIDGVDIKKIKLVEELFKLPTDEKNEIIVECLETVLDTDPNEIDKIFEETAVAVEPYLDNSATVEEIKISLVNELNTVEEEYT